MSKASKKMTFGLIILIVGAFLASGGMTWAYMIGQLPPQSIPTIDDLWPLFMCLSGLNMVVFGAVTLSINAQAWVIEGVDRKAEDAEFGLDGAKNEA